MSLFKTNLGALVSLFAIWTLILAGLLQSLLQSADILR